jgi:hypothetical protein
MVVAVGLLFEVSEVVSEVVFEVREVFFEVYLSI